jgi:hypothetical protein
MIHPSARGPPARPKLATLIFAALASTSVARNAFLRAEKPVARLDGRREICKGCKSCTRVRNKLSRVFLRDTAIGYERRARVA